MYNVEEEQKIEYEEENPAYPKGEQMPGQPKGCLRVPKREPES